MCIRDRHGVDLLHTLFLRLHLCPDGNGLSADGIQIGVQTPVSYTHLDVYKRQVARCLVLGAVDGNSVPHLILHDQHTELFKLFAEFADVIACLLYTSRCV